jgi:hypothetical protein
MIASLALLLAAPAAGAKPKSITFGSTLSQPPTVTDPVTCDTSGVTASDDGPCTRVALGYAATGAVAGRVSAPVSGTIKRVRVRAAKPATVRLTLVRVRNLDRPGAEAEGRAVSRGALLRVQAERPSRPIESCPVNLKVHKGDYLALEGSAFNALRCQGGDSEQLLFNPPLAPFGAWTRNTEFDDCTLLVQATIRTKR